MDKKLYFSIIAAFLTIAAIALFALLAAPIAKPLAWALIIGIATMPHHNRLEHRFPEHPSRAAGLMVLAVSVCFILPLAGLVIIERTGMDSRSRKFFSSGLSPGTIGFTVTR